MDKRRQAIKYIVVDTISAMVSWTLFFWFRKYFIESNKFGRNIPFELNSKFFFGLLGITVFWLLLYQLTGYYRDPYRKSRIKELGQTFMVSLIGVLIIFFALILDETVLSYHTYYLSLRVLFCLHFTLTFLPRLILSSRTNRLIHARKIGFNTLLIGSNEKAFRLFQEMQNQKINSGNKFIGFIHLESMNGYSRELQKHIPHLGEINCLAKVVAENKVEEIILAVETSEHKHIESIMNQLGNSVCIIKVIPDMYDILAGSVRMTSIFDAPLIQISHEIMPAWQQSLKRFIDIGVSLFVLIGFSWLYLLLVILVKTTSKGPAFYSHHRIGKGGKPFLIYKFRSMYTDAEKGGPALASETDPRITKVGRILRKIRIDELPQFYNVLIGDMALVGPRPERQFFIDQIIKVAPHYQYLHKVRPGITSWGQVKYGYAENVDQMVVRLQYDIIYVENMSLMLDIKILIYTVMIVLQGRGK